MKVQSSLCRQVMRPDGYGWPQMVLMSRLSSEFCKQSKIVIRSQPELHTARGTCCLFSMTQLDQASTVTVSAGDAIYSTLFAGFSKQALFCAKHGFFASLYDDTGSSDVVVKAENVEVCAHRAVLAAHSPSFKAMFTVSPSC